MRNELSGKLEKLKLQTVRVRIYRLDYSSKKSEIGKGEPDKDSGYAFIV